MSTLSTPMPARPITFSRSARASRSAVTLVAERIGEPVIAADGLGERRGVAAQLGAEIDLDAAIAEDLAPRRPRVASEIRTFGMSSLSCAPRGRDDVLGV
ncbi:MAG: hypothetical protein KatS3mg118_2288 [Paracoccaceae bacterium]|nr:MAG: hypothetical protein KatS3mg118_2288 [Paracoccaceae bacterium]